MLTCISRGGTTLADRTSKTWIRVRTLMQKARLKQRRAWFRIGQWGEKASSRIFGCRSASPRTYFKCRLCRCNARVVLLSATQVLLDVFVGKLEEGAGNKKIKKQPLTAQRSSLPVDEPPAQSLYLVNKSWQCWRLLLLSQICWRGVCS